MWVLKPENDLIWECGFCHNEAYWDTDYGQQLFDYCPYCGKKQKHEQKTRKMQNYIMDEFKGDIR